MSAKRLLGYLAAVIVTAAIAYYFMYVHKPADYQHPMYRSGLRG